MKSNIIALTQKDLHKLGQNLGGVCLGYNCYLYENDLHTHNNLCEALGYEPSTVKWSSCYQVAYSYNTYGNSGQLHRVELELVNGEHLTRFVYYTCIKYND
nr:MAG TPA: hypothetical protein [Caudoviricetes sp.]